MDGALRALAEDLGVEAGYHDVGGRWHVPSTEALLAVVGALGHPLDRVADAEAVHHELRAERARRLLEPVVVVAEGAGVTLRPRIAATDAVLRLDLGATAHPPVVDGAVELAGGLPVGVHHLTVDAGAEQARTTLVVAPRTVRGIPAGARWWGVFAPLYALGGSPTYEDLDRLAAWLAGRGGSVVATLPLLAAFAGDPSPYTPLSRRFWNERYAPPAAEIEVELGERSRVATARQARNGVPGAGYPEPPDAERFARFVAAAEALPAGRSPATLGEADLAGAPDDRVAWHRQRQREAARRLGEVADRLRARGQRLYLDLPLGSHPEGYDVWDSPHLFAAGVSAGAPPDEFFSGGQDWGFPPLHPERSRTEGHQHLWACLERHASVAGMLRVDHVMQVQRLFWVPDGLGAREGVYVRYPREELLALLAVASHRHDCVMVGEDLGTVPDEVREAMGRWGMPGMYVLQFSVPDVPDAPPPEPAPGAVASCNTHDTPTFAGWLRARDLDLFAQLDLLDPDSVDREQQSRARQVGALRRWAHLAGLVAEDADDGDLHAAVLTWLGRSPAGAVLVNLEDCWGEVEPQNVPGTPPERPNWVQRFAHDLDALTTDAVVAERLGQLARARGEVGLDDLP